MAKKAARQKVRDPDGLARIAAAQGVLEHAPHANAAKARQPVRPRYHTTCSSASASTDTARRRKKETHAAHSPGIVCTPRCTLLLLRAAAIAYAVRKRGLNIRREEQKEKKKRNERKEKRLAASGNRKRKCSRFIHMQRNARRRSRKGSAGCVCAYVHCLYARYGRVRGALYLLSTFFFGFDHAGDNEKWRRSAAAAAACGRRLAATGRHAATCGRIGPANRHSRTAEIGRTRSPPTDTGRLDGRHQRRPPADTGRTGWNQPYGGWQSKRQTGWTRDSARGPRGCGA